MKQGDGTVSDRTRLRNRVRLRSNVSIMDGKTVAVGLAKMAHTKYWVAGDDYEFGHALADSIWNNLKTNVQLLGQTWWKVEEYDFTPYIIAITAAKPDFVIVATGGGSMAMFLKAAQATGLADKIPFYQMGAVDHAILEPLGMNAPEEAYEINRKPITQVVQALRGEFPVYAVNTEMKKLWLQKWGGQ